MATTRLVRTRPDGMPVYGWEPNPAVPPVGVVPMAEVVDAEGPPPDHLHTHDFFLVIIFERDGGTLRFGRRDWPVRAGDVYLISPGDAVGIGEDRDGLRTARGQVLSFTPEVLAASGSLLTWHAHPLLFPFAQPVAQGPRRLTVPAGERDEWTRHLGTVDRELRRRQPGHQEAVVAALTLVLVSITRLARADPWRSAPTSQPVVVDVFTYIDERFDQPISLRDVARAVGLSPGHLTTVIGRRTGRTVGEWIRQRRLAEARRLLAATDLAVEAVARQVGFGDASYFARVFRDEHGATPLAWRRAALELGA